MKNLLALIGEIMFNMLKVFLGFMLIIVMMVLFIEIANANTNVYKSLIAHEASLQGLDPAVALAVAEVESNYNPKATGKHGEVGLFQLHPKWHKNPSYDVNENIKDGVSHLIYWRTHCPTKKDMTYVVCFNRGTRPVVNPKTAPYYKKFIRQYKNHNPPTTSPVRADRVSSL